MRTFAARMRSTTESTTATFMVTGSTSCKNASKDAAASYTSLATTVTVQLPGCAGSHAADAATLVELTGCSAAPPATLPLGRTAKLYMRGKSSSSSVQSKARSCTTVVSAMAGASKPIHSCPPNGGEFILSVT